MKPVDKFSIQYSELLEYIYPVTQEYFPDFDYDEETKSLISNNAKISGSTANSYIKIDLTTSENDKKITIDSLVSTYRHY